MLFNHLDCTFGSTLDVDLLVVLKAGMKYLFKTCVFLEMMIQLFGIEKKLKLQSF